MQTTIFSFVVLLLYARVGAIGTYPITVGNLFAATLIVLSLYVNFPLYRGLRALMMAIYLPLLLYGIHLFSETRYAIELSRFLLSYSLWIVSITIVWCAFQKRAILNSPNPLWGLIALSTIAGAQYFGMTLFNWSMPFDIVAQFAIFDLYNSYVNIISSEGIRAIGTYYEPSMLGRVAVTLATMLMVHSGQFLLPGIMLIFCFIVSKSFSIVVLAGINYVIYYGSFSRKLLYLGLPLIAGILFLPKIIADRLYIGEGGVAENSTYSRVVLPLEALSSVLLQYPLGVPIGANETVTQNTLSREYGFREEKITNGLYEIILYFGVPAIFFVGYLFWWMLKCYIRGDRSNALIIAYLLLSTAASSSYLSLESSVLVYFFIVSMRASKNVLQKPAKTTAVRVIFGGEHENPAH